MLLCVREQTGAGAHAGGGFGVNRVITKAVRNQHVETQEN